MATVKFKAYGDKVLVDLIQEEEQGIFNSIKDYKKGIIISLGHVKHEGDNLKEQDIVYLNKNSVFTPITLDNKKYHLIRRTDIIGFESNQEK